MSRPGGLTDLLRHAHEKLVPMDVSIELTHRCNFRCVHCFVPDHDQRDGLSTRRILELLEELADMGTLFLTLTGGEPLRRRDWDVIAHRSRDLGFSLHVLTNASLVDDTTADTLAALDAAVEVSLYSVDPGTFDGITNVRGSFDRTIRGIERLSDRGVRLLLKAPVMAMNRAGLPDVFAYAERIGAECRAFAGITHRKDGNVAPVALRLDGDDLTDFFRTPFSTCRQPVPTGEEKHGPLCAGGTRYANVTATGDVMACNILPGSAGNLRDQSFRVIWESSPWLQRLRSIRRDDLHGCRSCDKLAYCGRCHAQALAEDGDLLGRQRSACERAAALEKAFDRPA